MCRLFRGGLDQVLFYAHNRTDRLGGADAVRDCRLACCPLGKANYKAGSLIIAHKPCGTKHPKTAQLNEANMAALHNKRILVVEDDIVNLAVISAILRRFGAEVFEINPQFHSLQAKSSDYELKHMLPIDIVVTDIMLPKHLSGYDVFDQLRAIPALATIPFVAVTAHNDAEEMAKARKKGFAGFISKPIRINTFERYLADILAGKPVWIGEDCN